MTDWLGCIPITVKQGGKLHNLVTVLILWELSVVSWIFCGWKVGEGQSGFLLPIPFLVTSTTKGAVFCGRPEVCSPPVLSPDSFQYTPSPQKPPQGEAYAHSFGLASEAASWQVTNFRKEGQIWLSKLSALVVHLTNSHVNFVPVNTQTHSKELVNTLITYHFRIATKF